MQTITYTLPSFWAVYLFNDDPSGMTCEEIAMCDSWMHNRNLPAPCDIEDVGFMRHHDAETVALACDCSTYTFLIHDEVPHA